MKVKELNEAPYPAVRGPYIPGPKDGYQDVRFPFSGRSAEHTLGNSNPDLRVLSPNKSDTQPVITISTSEGTPS